MPTLSRTVCITLLATALTLAACGGESSDRPSQLDTAANAQRLTQTAQAQPTRTPWPTEWPSATPPPTLPPTVARISPTPYPTRDRSGPTEVPMGTLIPRGDWLSLPFTDDGGETRTLDQFMGRAVVLQTLSASCAICIEQQGRLLVAAQDRYDLGLLSDTVFVALDVVPGESAARLRRALQAGLSEHWPTAELILSDDVAADYVFGAAGPALVAALERDFGPDAAIPEAVTVIVIEPDGTAHLLYEGLVDWHDLRDAITLFGNQPPDDGS